MPSIALACSTTALHQSPSGTGTLYSGIYHQGAQFQFVFQTDVRESATGRCCRDGTDHLAIAFRDEDFGVLRARCHVLELLQVRVVRAAVVPRGDV
ncbi:hypothetical protein StoSoilB13_37380 (plasmid) [Arthrobacter sp. StoSoilB13]|nr:hypothetical protein StoSoilB13_37380 [Arthrobacter sp. StoSoilB13]